MYLEMTKIDAEFKQHIRKMKEFDTRLRKARRIGAFIGGGLGSLLAVFTYSTSVWIISFLYIGYGMHQTDILGPVLIGILSLFWVILGWLTGAGIGTLISDLILTIWSPKETL